MTFSNTHLKAIEIETERRLSARTRFDPYAKSLWDNALNSAYLDDNITMQKAYSFAEQLEYKHKGLTKDVYFSHPLRVSSLSVLFNDYGKSELSVIGLLHNVFEVTDLRENELEAFFSKDIVNKISTLTVNRELQWDFDYKKLYYHSIRDAGRTVMIVKIFDKLDNLFLLHLNQNNEIKKKYIYEVERFLLPMVDEEIPILLEYMKSLIKRASLSIS